MTPRNPEPIRRRATRAVGLHTALLGLLAAAPLQARTAEYELVFEGFWHASHATLPYPNGAHFTTLVGASHVAGDPLWQSGELASPGIEDVAEIGFVTTLLDEIAVRASAGNAGDPIVASGIDAFPDEMTTTFFIDADHPEVSLASMVAPSPDWFVGVSGLSLRDANGWIPTRVVDLMPYDAGSEDGSGFSLSNPDSVPRQTIAMRGSPFVPNAVIGRLHFTLLPEPSPGLYGFAALAALSGAARSLSSRRTR